MSDTEMNITGKQYWRSLNELADTPEFREWLHREFPAGASEMTSAVTRRNFLGLMGASLALAGLAGCRRPVEKIIPYVAQPQDIIPGVAQYYATTMPFGLSSYGLIVESHEGRPTKIEGNELHPSTGGKASSFALASILNLYDPDRSAKVLEKGAESAWDKFAAFWRGQMATLSANGGDGLAILTESFSSPTRARLRDKILATYPKARFVAYEPVSDENIYEGTKAAFGSYLRPDYHYDKAGLILALDSDFLGNESESIVAAKRFADSRRLTSEHDSMSRLYVVEPQMTPTGGMADHRLRLPRSLVGSFTVVLALELVKQGLPLGIRTDHLYPATSAAIDRNWVSVLARDLMSQQGHSVVRAGRSQPPAVHALAAAINSALGNIGTTILYRDMLDNSLPQSSQVSELLTAMRQGQISTLIMIGTNPIYDGAGLGFEEALKKVPHTVHLSSTVDETSAKCGWHLPRTHYLENWDDTRASDGTLSVTQPLIEPLLSGQSDIELMHLIGDGAAQKGYEIVRSVWQELFGGVTFESRWRQVLHGGILKESALPAVQPTLSASGVEQAMAKTPFPKEAPTGAKLEVVFEPSPSTFDGRFANNGWLQELPHLATKLTWDNAAVISPKTAETLGVSNEDILRLSYRNAAVELPVWIQPGVADNLIAVDLGYGRQAAGKVGNGVGQTVYPLRADNAIYGISGVTAMKTGATFKLAPTQEHGSMEGRPIIREATLDKYRQHPEFAREMVEHPPLKSINKDHDYSTGHQWGMAIDLNSCVGCNACTIACQSENNIPIVGKEQVRNGREMHWIRLDRYFAGSTESPEMSFMPVACQHCENAPCESVCPVAATSHDAEGLNVMTYNRCIGTRYCSNNCPYKVRRFNFFNYTKSTPEIVKMAMNPDVTVRSRGVMEKCTFCLQRIKRVAMTAKQEKREIKDGELRSACQQACPADAISFGNLNDPQSKVVQIKKQNRNYELLGEFNTRPRNSYLARIRNPHPELAGYKPENG